MFNLPHTISTTPFRLLAENHNMDRSTEGICMVPYNRDTQQGESMDSVRHYLPSRQHLRLFQLFHHIHVPSCFRSTKSYLHCQFYQSATITVARKKQTATDIPPINPFVGFFQFEASPNQSTTRNHSNSN
jgi:hypothetical protein